MQSFRPLLRALTVALVCAAVVDAATAHADGLRLRVRGAARITAHASRDASDTEDGLVELVLSGTLSDDAGRPVHAQPVTATVTLAGGGAAAGLRGARSCDSGSGRPPTAYAVRVTGSAEAPSVVATTDETGRFCFRARLPPVPHQASLSWSGSPLVERTALVLPFDLSRRATVLRFDPTPRVISLDAPQLAVDVAALVEGAYAAEPMAAAQLVLAGDGDRALGLATTDAAGRARFVLEPRALGGPGRGVLRVSFAGDRDAAFASHAEDVERRAKVSLRVPAAEQGTIEERDPEDGIPLDVEVTSVVGPVPEGTIEAWIGDVIVGAAHVEAGRARLTLTFAAEGPEATAKLRYVPASPWYEPASEIAVRLPIRGPTLWTKAPILAAGLAVIALFLVGRVASQSSKPGTAPARAKEQAPDKPVTPRVEVVRAAARGESGFEGTVVDAHEGTPVPNARVTIERGTFDGVRVLASATSDARGRFRLDLATRVGDEQLVCEAPLHARHAQRLPPDGELSIAVVARRRALLAKLVTWARRRGRPFDVKPEPTPGHVRRAAGDDAQTAEWADAVERAVFGAAEVDANVEGAVDRLVPKTGADAAVDAVARGDLQGPPSDG